MLYRRQAQKWRFRPLLMIHSYVQFLFVSYYYYNDYHLLIAFFTALYSPLSSRLTAESESRAKSRAESLLSLVILNECLQPFISRRFSIAMEVVYALQRYLVVTWLVHVVKLLSRRTFCVHHTTMQSHLRRVHVH